MDEITQAIIEHSKGNSSVLQGVIKKLEANRDQYTQMANMNLGRMGGQIDMLQAILDGKAAEVESTVETQAKKVKPGKKSKPDKVSAEVQPVSENGQVPEVAG